MIDLSPDDHAALSRIVAAGAAGLPLAGFKTSTVITLGVYELVTITKPPAPQRAIATHRGAAFLRRGVHA